MAVSEEKEFAMFGIYDGDSMLKERILVSKSYYDFMQLLTISITQVFENSGQSSRVFQS